MSTVKCGASIVVEWSTVNCQLSIKRAGTGASPLPQIDCQLSTVNCQLSTVNCLSTFLN
ncbi:MAG: hypothetical protein JGK29_02605 [Microcoleus sp. PH2017_17_BER_D_A]|nr:hypothetical protein [Microcoleus sp. PH2017_17_BER_D_A]